MFSDAIVDITVSCRSFVFSQSRFKGSVAVAALFDLFGLGSDLRMCTAITLKKWQPYTFVQLFRSCKILIPCQKTAGTACVLIRENSGG